MNDQNPMRDIMYGGNLTEETQNASPMKSIMYGQSGDVQGAEADLGDQNFNNLCEKFVEEQVYGHSGIFKTANDAWNHYVNSGVATSGNIAQAPAGSMIYFAPDNSNGGDGHVALADGKGNIIGATANGVQLYSLEDWLRGTGQQPLGFVPTGK